MLGLTKLEIWLLGLVVVVFYSFGIYELGHHHGYLEASGQDATLAVKQQAEFDKQKAIADKRIGDAESELIKERGINARPSPPTHVVCYAPSPKSVPATREVPKNSAPSSPVLPNAEPQNPSGPAFDPGPDSDKLAAYADDLVAQCRALNDEVPH